MLIILYKMVGLMQDMWQFHEMAKKECEQIEKEC